MADLVTEDLKQIDARFESIQKLSKSVSWMNGIIFYLDNDHAATKFHRLYMDSEWALTSINQLPFWDDIDIQEYGNGNVESIFSVVISDWDALGSNGKAAKDCDLEEIKEEVLYQVNKSLKSEGVKIGESQIQECFLDKDIASSNGKKSHKHVNLEPLLINRTETWDLRPEASTDIPNLFVAADYVKTNTDLATMESANEAGRRAANAVINQSGRDSKRVSVYEQYDFLPLKPVQKLNSLISDIKS
jgi:uncharacterized protein with NAD-binding domain and iron-sulfur cluster